MAEFWGLVVKAGETKSVTIPEDHVLTVSNAAFVGKANETAKLYAGVDRKYVLCTVSAGRTEQVSLDVTFFAQNPLSIGVEGAGEIHLVGSIQFAGNPDEYDDSDEERADAFERGLIADEASEDDEDDEDEESDSEMMAPAEAAPRVKTKGLLIRPAELDDEEDEDEEDEDEEDDEEEEVPAPKTPAQKALPAPAAAPAKKEAAKPAAPAKKVEEKPAAPAKKETTTPAKKDDKKATATTPAAAPAKAAATTPAAPAKAAATPAKDTKAAAAATPAKDKAAAAQTPKATPGDKKRPATTPAKADGEKDAKKPKSAAPSPSGLMCSDCTPAKPMPNAQALEQHKKAKHSK